MSSPESISMLAAFSAGVLSFFSPCVLPLLPSYISFISGRSFNELSMDDGSDVDAQKRKETIIHSVFFVIGLSSIFILLGASATYIGDFLNMNKEIIQKIGGVIIIAFGIHITGLIKLNMLMKEKRFHMKKRPPGYLGSALIGVAFATGWTPCIGPILGSILIYAATGNSIWTGMILLSLYSIGLGIPFIIASASWNKFFLSTNKIKKHMQKVSLASGALLVATGTLIYTDSFSIISAFIDEMIN